MKTYHGNRNLLTPHVGGDYGDVMVYCPSPSWSVVFLCPSEGQSFVAKGGEYAVGYRTPSGIVADGFTLQAGERATVVRWDEKTFLAEWQVVQA